jgi:hypothetical protein
MTSGRYFSQMKIRSMSFIYSFQVVIEVTGKFSNLSCSGNYIGSMSSKQFLVHIIFHLLNYIIMI